MKTKSERIEAMYDYAVAKGLCKNRKTFAELIDANPTNIGKAFQENSPYLTDKLLSRINASLDYVFNPAWLLTGEGEMLNAAVAVEHGAAQPAQNTHNAPLGDTALPLIPIAAVAGFNGIDPPGALPADCTLYNIPEFTEAKAEYLIRVSGSSMYPKYASGDILACRKIQEVTFLQWGKIYVIDSQQGAMVKRLFEIPDDSDHVLCKSDNPDYPPFRLPKLEIRSLSIVVGAIRLE